jgi:hypothetical protein
MEKLLITKNHHSDNNFRVTASATAAAVTVNQFETTLLHCQNIIKMPPYYKNTMQISSDLQLQLLLQLHLLQILRNLLQTT